MKPSKKTIIRTVITFATLLNSVLVLFNKNPLPYSETQIYAAISGIIGVLSTLWAWWKNNSFTQEAIEADKLLRELKGR